MTEVSADQLRRALEAQHGGTATLVQSVPVRESFRDVTVWDGVVHVFDLADHPKAKRAYAWSYERDDGKRRFGRPSRQRSNAWWRTTVLCRAPAVHFRRQAAWCSPQVKFRLYRFVCDWRVGIAATRRPICDFV